MKKLKLNWACDYRGADMGRPNLLPEDPAASIRLRLERLRWVDGDYDQGGAYWGNSGGTDIYCAWGEDEKWQVRVFVRAASRDEAKAGVRESVPGVTFYR